MIKIYITLLMGVLLTGCGESDVNLNKAENEIGFYGDLVLFADQKVTGDWAQYEFNDDGNVSDTAVFKHKFRNDGIREINVPLLNQWFPLGLYGVDVEGTKIMFKEGNNSIGYFKYISRDDAGCTLVGQYANMDANDTLSDVYLFCKEF